MCLWWEAEVASCTLVFQCGSWPAVSRRDSGNKDRVWGSLMRVLMYVHFYSLGTLHNPIGAVAPWYYTYTSTLRIHRVYARCLVYYIISMDGLSLTGWTWFGPFMRY